MSLLPLEICMQICGYLDNSGLKRAHLISRSFASASEPRLFETFYLRCNLDRFEKLHEISSHSRIRHLVKKIHYETRLYENCGFDFWCAQLSATTLSEDERISSYLEYQAYLEEQTSLNSRDVQVDRLSKAIRNFPNITSICLDNSSTIISKPLACLQPLESSEYLESLQPRANPRHYSDGRFATVSKVAKSVLPGGIEELCLAGHGLDFVHGIELPDVALNMLWEFLSKLQSLEIDLLKYLSFRQSKLTHIEFCTFTEILKRAEGLRKLNISSSHLPKIFTPTKEILKMLEPPGWAFVDRVLPRRLPWALTHLKLGTVSISSAKLLEILGHMSDTIRSLQLFDIGLAELFTSDFNSMAALTTHSWIFIIHYLAEKLRLSYVDFGGFLTNLQTESWRVSYSPCTTRSGTSRDTGSLSMKERVTNYVLRKGISPFSRRIGAAGDIKEWTQDDIDRFKRAADEVEVDGGRQFLLWDFEEDESWWFDKDAWRSYNSPPITTI